MPGRLPSIPVLLGVSRNPFSEPADSSKELWQRLATRRPSPLRFVLHLSRRPNAALCPCLEVDLASSTSPSTSFTVTRILDPEHRVPYITLTPILHAAGLTIIQGLLRFDPSPSSFDLSLAGLEPWDDLWISLPLARSIASQLGLSQPLALILDAKSAQAWSLDEFEEGLSHNWRVPQDVLDAAAYSTDAITDEELRFDKVQLLPQGQQIETLLSRELRWAIVNKARESRRSLKFKLHQNMVRWSSQVYSVFRDFGPTFRDDVNDEERKAIMRAGLDDLGEVVVPPTETDFIDWLQTISCLMRLSESPAESSSTGQHDSDSGSMLAPLTPLEVSDLRGDEPTLGDMLASARQGDDEKEIVSQLHSILRSRMAALHNVNLISLEHLSSTRTTSHDVQHDRSIPASTMNGVSTAERSPATEETAAAPAAAEAATKVDVSQLHAKVEQLANRIESLLASSPPTLSLRQSRRADQLPARRSTDVEQHPHLPAPSADARQLNIPVPTLTRIESTPSLAIVIVSAAVFLMLIKSNS
ncbi:calcium-transporting ATPase [Pseudozyma hubeiensis SY62]|uniref:Calcium-transporting ATPase n=1 Tax=Pseudozyma hubeiensis (strain SY62) TaxID=1305764 RepID=R9P4Q8_PSEHS|nr:calcium-transporting ATPase [Pseudozyma hubeiensis SY62]GAC96232.1 calcium-transporting ATPase [Pseudozyma hubeiensis SY62]